MVTKKGNSFRSPGESRHWTEKCSELAKPEQCSTLLGETLSWQQDEILLSFFFWMHDWKTLVRMGKQRSVDEKLLRSIIATGFFFLNDDGREEGEKIFCS